MLAAMTIDKKERLEARVTSDQKQLFLRAASVAGRSLTDFMIQVLTDASKKIIHETEIISLTREDAEMVMSSLLNSSGPTEASIAAMKRYRKLVESRDE